MSTEVMLKYSCTADHEVLQIRHSHCCHAIGAAILVSLTLIAFVNPLSLVAIKFYRMMNIAPLLDFIDRLAADKTSLLSWLQKEVEDCVDIFFEKIQFRRINPSLYK